jgi:hypothetical protein
MRIVRSFALVALLGCSLGVSNAMAVTLPVIENFNSTNQNWKNSNSALTQDTTWISSGGPSGASDAFIQSTFTTPASGTPSASQVLFRARNTVNSSGNVFFGNWIADGVQSVDFWIRQDTGSSIDLGLRIPTSAGFPAMLGRFPIQIPSNVWTHVSMAINATNPELLDETGPTHANFSSVFSNVTYLQIFANLSGLPNSTTVHFDVDGFRLVPEPSTWVLASCGGVSMLLACIRRRRAARA